MKKVIVLFLVLIIAVFVWYFVDYSKIWSKPKLNYQKISKMYFAPKSHIKIQVISKSYVENHSDLGNGNAIVKLYSTNKKSDTLLLKTSPENIDFIEFRNQKIKFECSQMEKYRLYDFLVSVGFQNLNQNEISELRDAMTLINYGSKATFLKGQTKFVEVEK